MEAPATAFGKFLTESMYGLNPAGSWENTRDQLNMLLQQSDKLGGPVIPYSVDPENYECVRPGDISIAASYPDKSQVLVSNYRTGDYFMVPYTIAEDGSVAIGDPTPAELEVSAKTKEALQSMRESGQPAARAYPLKLQIRLKEAKFNKDGTVEVMAIRRGFGNPVDKNFYDKDFIASIVPMLEATRAFRDHPTLADETNIPERSVDRLAGWFSDAREGTWTDPEHPELGEVEAAFAMFHPVVDDARTLNLLRTCAEMYAKYPDKEPFVAFSINAYGVGAPGEQDGQQCNQVSKCTELRSVDMVTQAGAAGRPMMESTLPMNPKKKTSESGKRIDASLPALTPAQKLANREAFIAERVREATRDLIAGPIGKSLVEASGEKPDTAGNFSNDQVDKIAAKAGFVKGGKMHQALEDALVDTDMDGDPKDEPSTTTTTEGSETLTIEQIDAMTPEERDATLRKLVAPKSTTESGKSARERELERKLAETNARVETLEVKLTEGDRKTVVNRIFDELKMSPPHRILCERQTRDAKSNDEIAEIVHAYYDAHIVEGDGRSISRGAVGSDRARESGAVQAPRFERVGR